MTDYDRGLVALAKLLPEADLAWIAHRDASSLPPIQSSYEHAATFILGERAVFLPEGLPHDCETSMTINEDLAQRREAAEAEIARLRTIVERASGMGLCSRTHHEHLMIVARAALRPEPAPEQFTGQMSWPCTCRHPKGEHYFGDALDSNGQMHTSCQSRDGCHHFTPAEPAPEQEAER
jgi:hypothetical protein